MIASQFNKSAGAALATFREQRVPWILTLAISAILLLLPEMIKLDGKQHGDWLQFLGRFHPLVVHLPIGLIVLVPVLEIAGAFRPALREAAGFVLALACAACLGSLMLGYLLAYGSGDTGTTVNRHLWGGITLTIGLLLCLRVRPFGATIGAPRAYPFLLCCIMIALLWTAHQGGSLTHGSDYLTRYMPASLKRLAPSSAMSVNPESFFTQHIHPILDDNCVACHGSAKTQGGLRVDSYDSLMKGGKDGPVITARNAAASMLIERVTLPPDNQHFMPAEGHPPLKPDQIAWLRAWIQDGASATASAVAGVALPQKPKELPLQPVGDYSSLMDEIRQMQHSQGAKILPLSAKPSDGLVLNTVDVAGNFGDTQLAQFQKFAPFIVEAGLARTAVTDASFENLARFTHLRALHLEGTRVTGSGLNKLTHLSQLTYLNLTNTKVTAANLDALKSMPNLQHVYLFGTPAQIAANDSQATAEGTR